ncbi:metallochaperone AztD [Devosia pacifica]|nr:metallochaperone AztD [Devosia pacifica]
MAVPSLADDSETHWRVFVADQADGGVTALDLDAPENRWQFELAGPARLYPSQSGAALLAVQSDNDQVSVFNSGISLDSHGDHADIAVSEPEQIDGALEGARPFHVVSHGPEMSINFDAGGYVLTLEESDLLEGRLDGTSFEQNTAHHGFAVPIKDYVISSVAAEPEDDAEVLPPRVGLAAFSPDGEMIGDLHTCTDLHGEAFSGSYLVAGCAEGIAALDTSGSEPVMQMLAYPDDLPAAKTGTLLGSKAMQVFLGNYGADALVVIDPAEEPHLRHIALPYRSVDFILDPAKPQFGYVLTEDGTLHRINLLTASIEDSAGVSEPYSMDGHWRDPRPRLAIAGGDVLMTDPLNNAVKVIDAETLAVSRSIEVEGLPYNIAVVGGSGLTH